MKATKISQRTKSSGTVLCEYTNPTKQLQVIQIVNLPGWYFERVIFPRQHLLFEAPTTAEVEVYTSCRGRGILVNKIPISELQIKPL
jgi:hypothetical protein